MSTIPGIGPIDVPHLLDGFPLDRTIQGSHVTANRSCLSRRHWVRDRININGAIPPYGPCFPMGSGHPIVPTIPIGRPTVYVREEEQWLIERVRVAL